MKWNEMKCNGHTNIAMKTFAEIPSATSYSPLSFGLVSWEADELNIRPSIVSGWATNKDASTTNRVFSTTKVIRSGNSILLLLELLVVDAVVPLLLVVLLFERSDKLDCCWCWFWCCWSWFWCWSWNCCWCCDWLSFFISDNKGFDGDKAVVNDELVEVEVLVEVVLLDDDDDEIISIDDFSVDIGKGLK